MGRVVFCEPYPVTLQGSAVAALQKREFGRFVNSGSIADISYHSTNLCYAPDGGSCRVRAFIRRLCKSTYLDLWPDIASRKRTRKAVLKVGSGRSKGFQAVSSEPGTESGHPKRQVPLFRIYLYSLLGPISRRTVGFGMNWLK